MRTAAIVAAILKDAISQPREIAVDLCQCLLCGRTFTTGKGVGTNGRFCHRLCVDAFNAGMVYRNGGLYRSERHAAAAAPAANAPWVVAVPAYEKSGAIKNPVGSSPYARNLQKSGDGFQIECRHCKRQFASDGLRCCSTECERQLGERRQIEAAMAEVGMQPIDREKRKCGECGITIPMWRKGRKVSAATRFCSESCAGKARRKAARKPAAAP
jgi:hypothetical protein